MLNIADILKERIEQFEKNPQAYLKSKSTTYQKDWNFAVKCFQERINKDRKKAKQTDLPFIAVRQKLVALKEIDDLRWFYRECLKYAGTYPKGSKIRNTFSKCFWGALK
jgi:hypothetical protein